MKKIIILIILAGSLMLFNVQAQDYYQGSVKVELTTTGPQVVFLMKLTAASGSKTNGFTGIEFFLTYSNTYTLTFGSVVNNTTNFPTLAMVYGGQNIMGTIPGRTNEWWYFTGLPTTSQTYTAGTEYEVFRVPISTSSLDFGDLNLEYDGTSFVTYLVFTDQVGIGWTTADQNVNAPLFYGPGTYSGSNGTGVLAGGSCMYTITDKPLVPMVLWEAAAWTGGLGAGNSPGSGDGAKKCYVRDLNGHVTDANATVLSLIVNDNSSLYIDANALLTTGTITLVNTGGRVASYLYISPNGALTATGSTTLSGAQQIRVLADATGVGSFIDNGTINYGTSGSADVQIYLANSGGVGSYFVHQVGPTVNDPAFQTAMGYQGVYLSAFDLVTLGTYAYFYQEGTNTWQNVFNPTTPVPTAKGLILSTTDNTNHTCTMTGKLVTGLVTTQAALGHSGNNIDLISDPYASGIDFDLFYQTNNTIIGTTYYIWNPSVGNYQTYTTPTGGVLQDKIEVGQGFFVTTLQAAPVTFINGHRAHRTGPFVKDATPYLLRLEAAGNTYMDNSFIVFKEGAKFNYDELYDAHKWASLFEDATEISTMSSDLEELTMNAVPPLGSDMVSVPMNFKCGAETTYTITASGIESFDPGTEIWLEDLVTGGQWHNLVANPVYTFTATPNDPQARFIVHFFGPTGINEPGNPSAIKIYGYGHDAYILNRGTETIEEYFVYDMMGKELQRGSLPNNTLNKVFIGDNSAYYVVKVITNNRIYSEKVFINK